MGIRSYRDLKVWQAGMELVRQVYLMTRAFPKHEVYGLCSQLQRAAVSIPANIAEGHTRSSTREFLRHLSIAQGSLAELETLLMLARDLTYCDSTVLTRLLALCDEESRMLSSLRRRLKQRLQSNP